MVKFLNTGTFVILLRGRQAGHKAVVVKTFENGTKERPYPHVIVAGVDRYPLRITRAMSKRTQSKRTRVKPFVKAVNWQHVMPTRYTTKLDLRGIVNPQSLEPARRKKTRQVVRRKFEDRHRAGRDQWLFEKLRF